MKIKNLLLLSILCGNCSTHHVEKITIEINGLYTPLEIGLENIDSTLDVDRYFSISLLNQYSTPISIATTGKEKFYSPVSTEYSYFSEMHNLRKRGRGISDFFSSEKTTINPFQSGVFYFYASVPQNADTVSFLFEYLNVDSTCFIETSYLLKNNKVASQINYDTYCNRR